jgi:hypothetical protein
MFRSCVDPGADGASSAFDQRREEEARFARYRHMVRAFFAVVLLASSVPALAQPTPASLETPPAALQLFERDWVLMNWALKFYDSNRDILLEPSEGAAAAEAFRKLADADNDGRVTPQEYRAARAFILARY